MNPSSPLEKAFVLHTRPYRETSLLMDFFTQHKGRMTLLAKGIKRSKQLALLAQPFIPLMIAWRGKGELPVVNTIEVGASPIRLEAMSLWCGLYLNELLVRVLSHQDVHEDIFSLYENTLLSLAQDRSYRDSKNTFLQQVILRLFEQQLLEKMGYALPLTQAFNTHHPIQPNQYYRYISHQGFLAVDHSESESPNVFQGKYLSAIACHQYHSIEVLRAAKKLMRLALAPLLGDRPLKSREVFL
ncbi:MAG: DNA repair protein RecO [Gammaproteobacteria bacterium GWF2_41_13]|nr:MAG: DNA repair protein RecO [Gammaproteobacteria bacterium GWF2_41_13]